MTRLHHLITVDLGSGGPKVALVSERGDVLHAVRREVPIHLLPNGGAEQDPEDWWTAIRAGVHEILAGNLVPVEDIVAINVASQWSVIVPVDPEGKPLMRAVHWMDTRGGKHTSRILGGWPTFEGYNILKLYRWIRKTGGVPTHSGVDSLSHILYILHERPDVYEKTHKFLEPVDYLGYRLSGRMVASYASIFPYVLSDTRNCSAVRYADDLVALAGVDRSKLPDLQAVDTVLGNIRPSVADELGLSHATQVMLGTGDSQAALLGSGAVGLFDPHVCIGTSSWLSCLLPFRKCDIFHGITAMPSAVPGKFMVMAEQGAAGKCLEAVVRQWFGTDKDPEPFEALLAAAAQIPSGSHGTLFLPWPNGAGIPGQEEAMRGGLLHVTLHTDRATIIRAVLEGVAMNIRWLAHHVERFIGRPIESVRFIGGAARSPLWCQILADVLGRPVHQVVDPHFAIVRGAAFAALMGMRRLRLEEIPAKVHIAQTFVPEPHARLVHDALYGEFLEAFRRTKPIYRRYARLHAPLLEG